MASLVLPLVKVLTEAEYLVFRDTQGVGFTPTPPPEHRPVLADWKAPLLHAIEEGERFPTREFLNLPRLAAVLAAREGVPPSTQCTFYYNPSPEPERVLASAANLLAHLRWRARNLPHPYRVHLAATDGGLVLDLEVPLEAFLRVEGEKTLELFLWPEWRMREYLLAAKGGRTRPPLATLEWKDQSHTGSWEELTQVVGAVGESAGAPKRVLTGGVFQKPLPADPRGGGGEGWR